MDGRRTYLDSLNAGRQRRGPSTLDDLSRSLERLGDRLERRGDQPHGGASERHQRPGWSAADEMAPAPAARPSWRDEAAPRDDAYQATTGRLAAEVKGLRDELRHQMTAGLQREFDSLRTDIARAYAASGPASSGKLAHELEHISDSIRTLSSRSDDKGINLLRLDVEQLRAELDTLAREDTVRSMDSRWDQMDQRWNELEDRIDARPASDPGLLALHERLQQITDAVNNLPESLSLRSLEDKVRTLSGSVDHFSQQDGRAPQLFAAIEQRLDEISRAIVASAAASQPTALDFEPMERIERRIGSLAEQLDELATRGVSTEIIDRLNALSLRIDDVARQAEVPARSVEKLSGQLAMIADRIDAGSTLPNADELMRGIENRFDQFAHIMERRQDTALESSHAMFRDLETRLYDVISKLDHRPEPVNTDNADLMEAIDTRLADFSRRLEDRQADMLDDRSIRELEAKIDTISSRFDNAAATAPQIHPDAIRNLESQIADLSAFLSKPDQAMPALDAISPRLEEMEKAIRGNRDVVMDAARRAAEDVARTFAGPHADVTAVDGLTQDLKALEAITKRSDDRNSKTFEAIHDTLLKIVDRLGSMETAAASPAEVIPATVTKKVSVKDAPSIVPAEIGVSDIAIAPRVEAETVAAPSIDEAPQPEAAKRGSMLRGLGSAFARKKKVDAPAVDTAVADQPAASDAPTLDLDQPLDPKAANRPMQPGSGTPDLSRIMKRVRDERAQQQPPKREDADAAKSDFIAAARRAAQAAAAEAEVLKRHSEIAGSSRGFKLAELLKARRKPILMGAAAVMIALAGLQLSKAFLSDRNVVTGGNVTAPVETKAATAAGTGASTPGTGADAVATPRASDTATMPAATMQPPVTGAVDNADEVGTLSATMPEPAGTDDAAPVQSSADATDTSAATETMTASVPSTTENHASVQIDPAPAAMPVAPADAGPIALREAADSGDPKAMFEIGARYSEGRGTKADNAKAAEWYERAAELGVAPAQYRIGNMYEKGVGVTRDLTKAKTWYQMASEQGNASAMHNLAVLYAMGADGTKDNESAARWFNKAADLGVKDSQFNLGILNAKGVGMPQNLEESYKWFALVAKTGDRDAAAKRDEIANSLRPEQLEKARATTELWKAKPVDPAANVVDMPDEWQESQEQTASVDMKKAVKTIQLILNKNGYDAGGADGVMGQKTRNAIVAFQKDNGLPTDGQVNEKLVLELLARK